MIQSKPKICSICGKLAPLWRSTPKTCKGCHQKAKVSDSEVKSPIKQYSTKEIKKVSKNMLESLKKYRILRDKYFEENPTCEFPGCNNQNITLHHKRGKIGAYLTDSRYFCSLCFEHHRWVEENPKEAQKIGLSQKRLTA